MGLYRFIIIIFMASTQISFTSSNRHSKFINGVPRKPINGHDGVPMPPPRRAIQEITYIAPTTGAGPMQSIVDSSEPITSSPILGEHVSTPAGGGGTVNWNPYPTDGPDYSEKQFAVKKIVVIIVAIVAVIAVVIAVLLAIILCCKLMNKEEASAPSLASKSAAEQDHSTLSTLKDEGLFSKNQEFLEPSSELVHSGLSSNKQMVSVDAGLSSNQQQLLEPSKSSPNISCHDIVTIKNYCRESRPIANGSFAKVYMMMLRGENLAIKELKNERGDVKKWTEDEGNLMMGKEHININKLYGWWIEGNMSYLAYMYIDGCSLEDYLRGNCAGFAYSWKESLKLIMGIAKGLQFLHLNEIIHVDIKPSNIMVDSKDNEAKLVDFGFSRHVDWQGTHRSTDKIIGTKGYWAPEYCLNHKLSYKLDVYSFGIVLLEMITGQRHVDQARGSSQFHIPGYVRRVIKNNRFEEAVDSKLKKDGWGVISVKEALSVAKIALRCAHRKKVKRPDMNDVVAELTNMMSGAHNKKKLHLRKILHLDF